MRSLPALLLVLVPLLACGDKAGAGGSSSAAARKPHDPVNGPAMWTIHVEEMSIQPLDADNKPKGEPKVVSERPSGTHACRLEKDPGNDAVTTWFTASFDPDGHSRMTHEQDTSVPKDLVSCAIGAAINTKLGASSGEFKVIVKAWFGDPKPQPR